MDILNIDFISPITNYKFNNKENNYYLVHIGINTIHKILLPNLDNVDDQLRAIFVNSAIKKTNHYAYVTSGDDIFLCIRISFNL